ncbi:unnamed protein product, partial [Phaedon cochleariae]
TRYWLKTLEYQILTCNVIFFFSERLNVLYEKNWTKLVTEQLKRFERSIVESGGNEGPFSASRTPWTFCSALLYSITLLTTVGYSKLSPKTVLGKISSMVYAVVGVPLMLILLSALGGFLAKEAQRGYSRMCCHRKEGALKRSSSSVGYRKAPTSPTGRLRCRSHDDSASIQIAFPPATPNHITKPTLNHHGSPAHPSHQDVPRRALLAHADHQDVPRRALLATVRRGRGGKTPVETTPCPTHSCHGTPQRGGRGVVCEADEAEDTDEGELVICPAHDTPSRIPLIWRPPEPTPSSPTKPSSADAPTLPALLVLVIFVAYVCAGALLLCRTGDWSFLDAVFFCFTALSTIGVGEGVPGEGMTEFQGQVQVIACCAYVFVGLVVVAMCFSLVYEEIAMRYRQIARNVGILRQ